VRAKTPVRAAAMLSATSSPLRAVRLWGAAARLFDLDQVRKTGSTSEPAPKREEGRFAAASMQKR
jgi:hypothetical protein